MIRATNTPSGVNVSARKASVSAKDVAARAGVSRAAVSRTFTPGASVSEETRSKVIAAAEALGYQVNHLARGLISQKTGIVAVVAPAVPYVTLFLTHATGHQLCHISDMS